MVTTDTLTPAVQLSFDEKILSTPTATLIHKTAATKRRAPRNGGTTVRMRRYNPLATALVPLGNSGVTPPAQNLTAVNIDAEMQFYGTYIYINEQVVLQSNDPVLNAAANRLGASLRQTEDELTRNMLAASASSINCVGGTNGDNPTEVSESDLKAMVSALVSANAYTITDNIEAQNKFGTAPVRNGYIGMCSSHLIADLENVTGFLQKTQYPAPMNAMDSEWGAYGNLRILVSSIGSMTTNASNLGYDVYDIFCTGLEAYSCIEQDGYSAKFIYLPPQYSGPLAMNCSVGYKFGECPVITNDEWIGKLRCSLR